MAASALVNEGVAHQRGSSSGTASIARATASTWDGSRTYEVGIRRRLRDDLEVGERVLAEPAELLGVLEDAAEHDEPAADALATESLPSSNSRSW
ncbi:MAG: hypothetical protein U0S48_18580 [Solirubrobacteraceae bacterium]